jgi:hypothetical protein
MENISKIISFISKLCHTVSYRNINRNKGINQIRAPGGHIQITIMIDTQQQYIKLNIRDEISIIVVQAHSGRKRDICT